VLATDFLVNTNPYFPHATRQREKRHAAGVPASTPPPHHEPSLNLLVRGWQHGRPFPLSTFLIPLFFFLDFSVQVLRMEQILNRPSVGTFFPPTFPLEVDLSPSLGVSFFFR